MYLGFDLLCQVRFRSKTTCSWTRANRFRHVQSPLLTRLPALVYWKCVVLNKMTGNIIQWTRVVQGSVLMSIYNCIFLFLYACLLKIHFNILGVTLITRRICVDHTVDFNYIWRATIVFKSLLILAYILKCKPKHFYSISSLHTIYFIWDWKLYITD